MSVKDERIGAIELVNKAGGDGLFAETDLQVLIGLSASAALAIVNARQAEALVEQERVRRELELAAEIQRSLLPSARPEPFPVHGINMPARTVSGDFYDFFEVEDGCICFNLGDVSGKGMNAALLMAKTASLYRCLGKTVRDPGKLMAHHQPRDLRDHDARHVRHHGRRHLRSGDRAGAAWPMPDTNRRCSATATATTGPCRPNCRPWASCPWPGPEEDFPETESIWKGGTLYVFSDGVTEGLYRGQETLEVDPG